MISVSWHLFYGWLEILLGMSSRENLQRLRRRTAPLVYLKFCAQIGGFSRATHDWSRE